jgi:hypothetical protein
MVCAMKAIAPVGWKPCMPGCDPVTCSDCTDQRAVTNDRPALVDQPTRAPLAALQGRQSTP